MISFSSQRFSLFFRSVATFICSLTIFSILSAVAHAQSNDELFRGTWQIDTPDQGALIIMVKSQGRAAYFWGDNTDRTVYQGTWTSNEQIATITWSNSSQHRIEQDNLGFRITHIDANNSERYTTQAQQVPSEILGQWAKPPAKDSELASDRDKAKGFFGVWKIGQDADAQYVFVEPDRSAATTEGGPQGRRGSWAKQGSELHIAWDSGHYSILRENKRVFAYKVIEPGLVIEDDESNTRPAARTIEENVPASWIADYRQEREVHTGGIAFSSRKTARTFYRGDWIVQLSGKSFERIEIARFGGLSTSLDASLDGDWRMQGQDIFMRWDDGMRKILSPIGRGFILYEYKPGRPLDGVPTRLRPAAPADAAKLAQHLKGREDVAQQISSLAEAAGIDHSEQESAGWGRTFARWAWPFGEDESVSSDAILQEEYEAASQSDPWWWPFWSERTPSQPTPPAVELEEADSEATANVNPISEAAPVETEAASNETEEAAPENTSKAASKPSWLWPF